MKILSINAVSDYLKFCLFDIDSNSLLAKGLFERIGMEGSTCSIMYSDEKFVQEVDCASFDDVANILLDKLISLDIIKSSFEINAVGHKVIHGKDLFGNGVLLGENVMEKLDKLKDEFPMYDNSSVIAIKSFKRAMPDTMQAAFFDTSFATDMEESTYLYPVPYSWYSEYGLRKYGFHAISHKYVSKEVGKIIGSDEYKLISCRINDMTGSISAIKNGKCVDNSMGFTPLSGLIMSAKSGDVDTSIIPYIMEREGKNASEVIDDLNNRSGLFGMSEVSDNINDIVRESNSGNHKASVAIDKFIRRIVDYIAQYYVLLNGADIITFTSDVLVNNFDILKEICNRLSCLGVEIDSNISELSNYVEKISSKKSKVLVYIVPVDEETVIAKDTYNLINR